MVREIIQNKVYINALINFVVRGVKATCLVVNDSDH